MKKVRKALAWATSRQGAHDISAAVVACAAVYKALHEAGVF